VRGFALKLVGVPGKKLIVGLEQEATQDFLFVSQPSLPFRDADEFMGFVRAAKDGPAKLVPRMFGHFGFWRALVVLRRVLSMPSVRSFATHVFHTGAPVAFGPTAAKLALFPIDSAPLPAKRGDDSLRDDLTARLKVGPLAWSLRAQVFVDDRLTPIEDTSVTWSGPWLELGVLTIPKQDPTSARGKEIAELVQTLSFDPWHSVEEHRPLGAIMRARAHGYKASVLGRNGAPEPKSVLSAV
jgi:hypothetical protein